MQHLFRVNGTLRLYARVLGFRFIRRKRAVHRLVADSLKHTKEGPDSVPILEKSGSDSHVCHLAISPSSFTSFITPEPHQTLEVSTSDVCAPQRRGWLLEGTDG